MKKFDLLDNIEIAHRGMCSNKYPENSLGAFFECVNKNIPIELDVHILKDNTLVVFHDDDTGRLTNKKIKLKDATYDDIRDLRLSGTTEIIPTLDDVLELVNGRVLLDIELKTDVKNFRICEELCKRLDKYNGKFIVKSFNPLYIWWFKKNRNNYIRGILISKIKCNRIKDIFFVKFLFYVFSKPNFIAINYICLPNKIIDTLYNRGLPILLFTIRGDKKLKYEYSGIIYESE